MRKKMTNTVMGPSLGKIFFTTAIMQGREKS